MADGTTPRKIGAVTVSGSAGAAAGTYVAILLVQFAGLHRWLDDTGVQALSGLAAIIGTTLGGYLAPPHHSPTPERGDIYE